MKWRSRRIRLGAFFSMLVLLSSLLGPVGPVFPAAAATLVVSSCDTGSLAQAISSAASGDTITFSCSGTITPPYSSWMSGFQIDKTVTIDGSGQNVTIDGGGNTSAFFISQNGNLTLNDLTFTHGMGGTYSSCQGCDQVNIGGVITNEQGSLTVKNSTFSNNQYSGLIGGGAILSTLGTVTIDNSTFSGNSTHENGAAIMSNVGTLTVTNSTFSNNTVSGRGGGIDIEGGTATISSSTFSNNIADAFAGEGVGAGVSNTSGTMTITNSTFSGNQGQAGGAIGNSGTLTVTNSTLSGNYASWYANGILTGVRDGIYLAGGGSTTIKNTILANGPPRSGLDPYNFGGNCVTNGTLINGGNNFDDDGTCGVTQVSTADLKLGALANNGGPTQTIALGSGSVAIDAGNDAVCAAAPVSGADQRNYGRPAGSHCDSGAYEFGAVALIKNTALSAVSGSGPFAGTATLTATLTANGAGVSGVSISFTRLGTPVGSATTSSNGVATLTNVSLAGINAASYPGAIGASFAGNSSYASSNGSGALTVSMANQTISFDLSTLPAKKYGDPAFDISSYASASSGLPVSFSSATPAICTVAGSMVTIVTSGTCTINANQAGNSNYNPAPQVQQSLIVTDSTPPTTTIGAVKADNSAYTFGSWTKQAVTITLSASDTGGSGLANTFYTIDGTQQTYTAPFTISAEGSHTVTFWSTDHAGNEETPHHSVSVKIDLTAPTTSARAINADNSSYAFGSWTHQAVTITLSPSDTSGSGVGGTFYTIDGGSQTTYAGPFALSDDQDHIITFWSTDQAGNVESTHTAHVQIDLTNPTISGAPTTSPNSNGWYSAPVTIHWTCGDALYGLASCPGDQTINTEGANQSISGTATDNAGNSTTVSSSPAVNLDLTAPTVTYTGGQATYGVNETVNITCTASDTLSGIATSTCQNISGPATAFAFGTNTFNASATDQAGNVGTGSVSFSVVPPDSTARALLVAINPSHPSLRAFIATGRSGSAPAGFLSYRDDTVSLSHVQLLSLTVVGIQATVYGNAQLADGTPVSFILDARATYPNVTVRLRLNNGYDSRDTHVSFVSISPTP